jgi:hypothetical protein
MRHLKISSVVDSVGSDFENTELQALIKVASEKHHLNDGVTNFLEEVRNGNSDSIAKLVEDSEIFILIAIGDELAKGDFTLQQLFDAGKKAVTSLAEQELNSTRRERFYRFLSFEVKQAIAQLKKTDRQ